MNDVNEREKKMKWKMKVDREESKDNMKMKWITHWSSLNHHWFFIGMVDTIFADVAQPDQARIVAINAHNFLKNGGHFVISIKVLVLNFGLNHIYIKKRSMIRLLDLYRSF